MIPMTSTLLDLASLARDIGKLAAPRILGSRQLLQYPDWTRVEVDDLALAIRIAVDDADAMEDPIAIEGKLPTCVLSRLSCELWPTRLLVRPQNGTLAPTNPSGATPYHSHYRALPRALAIAI